MRRRPTVSIVIPVYRDWQRLQLCLDALGRQTYSKNKFEIVVVQNDLSARPKGLSAPENTIFLQERNLGSYAARNTGLVHATGAIIGFTDADCIPDTEWIERAVFRFQKNPSVDRLAGRIRILTREPPDQSLAEIYELLFEFPQEVFVSRQGSCATANMFSRRLVFDRVGSFDDRRFSGGDIEWGRRAQLSGSRIIYANDVVVNHPARRSYEALLRKANRVGAGKRVHDNTEFLRAHVSMIKAFVPPVRMFARASKSDMALVKKIAAMLIHYQLKIVKAFSRLRVAYGKQPSRV